MTYELNIKSNVQFH